MNERRICPREKKKETEHRTIRDERSIDSLGTSSYGMEAVCVANRAGFIHPLVAPISEQREIGFH